MSLKHESHLLLFVSVQMKLRCKCCCTVTDWWTNDFCTWRERNTGQRSSDRRQKTHSLLGWTFISAAKRRPERVQQQRQKQDWRLKCKWKTASLLRLHFHLKTLPKRAFVVGILNWRKKKDSLFHLSLRIIYLFIFTFIFDYITTNISGSFSLSFSAVIKIIIMNL